MCSRVHRARTFATVFLGGVALLLSGSATQAADRLLDAVPKQATAVVLLDIGPQNESMKALAAAYTPGALAAFRPVALAGVGELFRQAAPGASLENDVLPWITRRAVAFWMPTADKKGKRPVVLLETVPPADAAGFERLLGEGTRQGNLVVVDVGGARAWRAAKPIEGTLFTWRDGLVVFAPSEAALAEALKEMPRGVRPAGELSVVTGLNLAPTGLVRFAALPPVPPAQQKSPRAVPKLLGLAGALRATAQGLELEVSAPVFPEGKGGDWSALSKIKPTFGESIAGIPENAAAVVVGARPAVWFHAVGFSLADELGGIPGVGATVSAMASDLFMQEAALALLPGAQGPEWVGVLSSRSPEALPRQMAALAQLGVAAGFMRNADPVGADPAWVVQPPKGPPLHLCVVGSRCLVAGSAAALEASAAALRGEKKSVSAAAWYTEGVKTLPPGSLGHVVVNKDALLDILRTWTPKGAPGSAKRLLRVLEPVSDGIRTAGGAVRVQGDVVKIQIRMDLDYSKLPPLGVALKVAAASAPAKKAPEATQPAP